MAFSSFSVSLNSSPTVVTNISDFEQTISHARGLESAIAVYVAVEQTKKSVQFYQLVMQTPPTYASVS